jgi:tetratricopeptide (TPR) repeat protein
MAYLRRDPPKLAVALAASACALLLLALVNRGLAPRERSSAGPATAGKGHVDSSERGSRYLQKEQATGDPSYYTAAERAFDVALRKDPSDPEALVGAGTLANSRHDFREGLRLGMAAGRAGPALTAPLTVVADAQIELGRYRAAGDTLQRMVDRKPTLGSYARASYYRELHGDLSGAVQAMQLAVSAGSGSPRDMAYATALLGDLQLQRGRPAAAREAFRAALAERPDDPGALAGLARVDAAGGRFAKAARRLRASLGVMPQPNRRTLLAEIELAAGWKAAGERDLHAARKQERRYLAAGAKADADLVAFEATHGDSHAAVRLGRRVWREKPSVRSADALGWALTLSGNPQEGLAWARRALRLGSKDPLFHLHVGLAAKAARRPTLAGRELRAALQARAALSPLALRRAKAALRHIG